MNSKYGSIERYTDPKADFQNFINMTLVTMLNTKTVPWINNTLQQKQFEPFNWDYTVTQNAFCDIKLSVQASLSKIYIGNVSLNYLNRADNVIKLLSTIDVMICVKVDVNTHICQDIVTGLGAN
jgi:hypothetical protein